MNSSFLSRAAAAATSVAVAAAFALPVYAVNGNPTIVVANGVATAFDTGDTITIPANLAAVNGDDVTVVVRNSAGTAVDLTGMTLNAPYVTSALNTGTFTVDVPTAANPTILTLTASPSAALTTGNYTVAIASTAGVGASVFTLGNANQVSVTATVLPTLTLALSGTPTLGTVGLTRVNSTGNTTLSVSTNAASGYIIQAAATTSDADMPLVASNALVTPGTAGFSAFISGVTGGVAAETIFNGATSTGVLGAAQDFARNNGVAAADTVVVTYSAQAIATTPADNYTMTTTYTATASF